MSWLFTCTWTHMVIAFNALCILLCQQNHNCPAGWQIHSCVKCQKENNARKHWVKRFSCLLLSLTVERPEVVLCLKQVFGWQMWTVWKHEPDFTRISTLCQLGLTEISSAAAAAAATSCYSNVRICVYTHTRLSFLCCDWKQSFSQIVAPVVQVMDIAYLATLINPNPVMGNIVFFKFNTTINIFLVNIAKSIHQNTWPLIIKTVKK